MGTIGSDGVLLWLFGSVPYMLYEPGGRGAVLFFILPEPTKKESLVTRQIFLVSLYKGENTHVYILCSLKNHVFWDVNTLRMGDADLRFYITTVQDG